MKKYIVALLLLVGLSEKELTLYANMSLTIASDPKLRKTTKVLY